MKHLGYLLLIVFFVFKVNLTFTQNTIGLLDYSSMSQEGYTLFAPINANGTYLIDNCGFLINAWDSEYKPGLMAYLLEDGSLLRCGRITSEFVAGGSGGRVEKISWNNELIWAYDFSNFNEQAHHDIAPLPNGNFLILLWDKHPNSQLIEMGRDTNFLPNGDFFWSEKIFEVKPIGTDEIEIVWEWNSWDHLIQDYDPEKTNFGDVSEHPGKLNINYPIGDRSADWLHMNSIDYNPELDQIVLNSRNFNEFYIIDHSTTTEEAKTNSGGLYNKGGDFLFRWGNPQAYNKGDEEDRKLFSQHDASWIPQGLPGEGNILVFNNGNERPELIFASTVEEIYLDQELNGFYVINEEGKFGQDTSLWTYPKELNPGFHSSRISGAQRLLNGNTLICNGQEGRFFEIDQNETIVWQYLNPIDFNGPSTQGNQPSNSNVFKIRRYNYDYPAFQDIDVHPIAQLELSPNPTDCLTTNLEQIEEDLDFTIYPNPFFNDINIDLPKGQQYLVEIFNQVGQKISSSYLKGSSTINANFGAKGIYLIKIQGQENRTVHTQTMIKL